MGFNTENTQIRDSLQIARQTGLKYEFFTAEEARYHPNTLAIEAQGENRKISLRGASIGGGQVRIQELNGFSMEAACLMDTLLVVHKDSPGLLANIAAILNVAGYNIANLLGSNQARRGRYHRYRDRRPGRPADSRQFAERRRSAAGDFVAEILILNWIKERKVRPARSRRGGDSLWIFQALIIF